MKIDNDFDFGFTTEDDPFEAVAAEKQTVQEGAKSALLELKAMYDPLLKNLAANPEKPIINWPNRAEKIKEFQAKVDRFINKKLAEL